MTRCLYDPPGSPEVWGDWQRNMETLLGASPPAILGSGRLSWPLLVWVAGDDWDPVERWVLYDMLPAQVLYEGSARRRSMGVTDSENQDQFWLDQLNGPHPRQRGKWDGVLKQFVADPECLIDRYQWELWRRHRAMGYPFWVLQGPLGGHPIAYSGLESQVAKLCDMPDHPAAPGSLPYVGWDQRTVRALSIYNVVRQLRLALALSGMSWGDAKQAAYRDLIVAGTRSMLTGIDEYWRDAVRSSYIPLDHSVARGDVPDAQMLNETLDERILTSI